MIQLKYHHDELIKAIAGKDFERAAYEIDEMKEVTEKAKLLNITNDKLKGLFAQFYDKYLDGPLNSLANAAAKKDNIGLHTNMVSLTNNCNSCHRENNMSFMHFN